MKINFLKSILLSVIVILSQPSNSLASHIVGGEINYECLGNNEYRISLRVYRDCQNGNAAAYFDNPAILGLFDAQTNNLQSTITMFLDPNNNDTISSAYPDSCVGANFCIHTTVYSKVVTLPLNSSGYVLSYQRCCRSQNILNIVDPNTTGMTLTIEITAAALSSCNNSPTFNTETPLFLGINDTFSLNLGATDTDGDSLAYTFYAPFNGATQGNPVPNPPVGAPYNSVSYPSPFNSQMPFGNTLCTWDSLTGDFMVVPTSLGVYAIGFSILEYNSNGDLLSTTYKDMIIVVGTTPCSPSININKIASPSTIKVFPNPTKGNLTIENLNNLETNLQVYSMQGQLLITSSFQKQTTLDLSQYPKGVYLLKFENENEQIVKRFIKE